MNIQWFSKDLSGFVTIYETNITLNTVASEFFSTAYKTIIGYDIDNSLLFIKPISKEDTLLGIYKENDLYNISIKPSYGRISGKKIVNKITKIFPLNFSKKKYYKFLCEWDNSKKYLKIYLNEEVI